MYKKILLCVLCHSTVSFAMEARLTQAHGKGQAFVSGISQAILSGNLPNFQRLSSYFRYCSTEQMFSFKKSINRNIDNLSHILITDYTLWKTSLTLFEDKKFPTDRYRLLAYEKHSIETKKDIPNLSDTFNFIRRLNISNVESVAFHITSAYAYARLQAHILSIARGQPYSKEYEEFYAKKYIDEERIKQKIMFDMITFYEQQQAQQSNYNNNQSMQEYFNLLQLSRQSIPAVVVTPSYFSPQTSAVPLYNESSTQ